MNKSKLLSAFMAVIMLVTTCCSTFVLNVGADDVTPVYYIQGGGTGDGRSESSPAGTMTQIIASITADNYNVAGQNVTVKVMAGDSKAYYQSGSESYTYDATITFEGYNNEVTAFVSKDSSNKVLVYGPSVFKNIKFYSPAASGDFELNCNGLNVTLENVYFAFSGGNTPNIGNVYIHQGNLRAYGPKGNGGVVTVDSATMSRAGTIGSSGYYDNSNQKYNNTYSEDVKVVLYSGTLNNLRFNSSKTGYPSVFNKNVNFVLNGTTVSALHNRNYQDTMGGVLQIIYNNGATINGTAGGYEVTVPRYDIYVENINGAALDTTETAGTYSIAFPEGKDIAKAYLLDSDGNKTETVYTNSGSTITVGDPGKYSVVFEKAAEEDTNPDEYFLKGGATGSGRTAGDAAGTMTALVQSIKDDGNNIAGKKITVKVINASENTGFGEANALYYNPYSYSDSSSTYSTVITHDATLVFESYDANSRGCLWTADATKYYFDYIRIGGPTVFRGIDIKINRASGSWFEMFCNGYDVTFDDVIFRLKDGSQSAVSNTIIHQGSWFHNNGSRLGGGGTITVDATTLTRLSYVNASGNMNENNDWYFTSGNQSFTDEVKIVIDKGTLSKELRIGGSYSGKEITYGDNLNIILNGTAVATMFSRNVVNIADGCAMQIIYNNGASISKQTTASGCTFPSTRYDIYVENINGAALDTTETAGTYSITFPEGKDVAKAYLLDSDGNKTETVYTNNGNTITVGDAGKYSVVFEKYVEPDTNADEYFLKGGATGSGRTADDAAGKLSDIVASMEADGNNVAGKQITVKILNATENTGFGEANALYFNESSWRATAVAHKATIIFESADTENRSFIWSGIINGGTDWRYRMRLGGPTIFRGIDIAFDASSDTAVDFYCMGFDATFEDVRFVASDKTAMSESKVSLYHGHYEHDNGSLQSGIDGGTITIDGTTASRIGSISATGYTRVGNVWSGDAGHQEIRGDIKLVIGNEEVNVVSINNVYKTEGFTFDKNLNIVLNGTSLSKLKNSGSVINQFGDGNAMQVIYNNGATIAEDTVSTSLRRYNIIVADGGALDTTDVAGTYTITFPAGKTVAVAQCGDNLYYSNGNTITVGEAGTYNVRFLEQLPNFNPVYYLKGGAENGDGSYEAPFKELSQIIDAIKEASVDVKDTVVTVKIINSTENTGFEEDNALYINPYGWKNGNAQWGIAVGTNAIVSSVLHHNATIVFESATDDRAEIFAAYGSDRYCALRLGGPTVLRNIDLKINRASGAYPLFATGYDLELDNVKFFYSDGTEVASGYVEIYKGAFHSNQSGGKIGPGGLLIIDQETLERTGCISPMGWTPQNENWVIGDGYQNLTEEVKLIINGTTANKIIFRDFGGSATASFGDNVNIILNGTTVTNFTTNGAPISIADGKALQVIYNGGATITNNKNIGLTRYDIFVENINGASLDTTDVAGTYTVTFPEGKTTAYAYLIDANGKYAGGFIHESVGNTLTVGKAGTYTVVFEYPEITDNDPMEYFLMGGATGSGRTAITPAGTMQDLVDSVEADGYNVEGTEITVKLINAGENTGYGEANALYYNPKWYDDNNSKLIIHKATFIYENFDDEDAGFFWNAKANKSEWKALRISGPSVFRGINFRVTTDYYKVFCNGFDTTFEDVYFRYSDGSLVPVEKTIIHQGVYEHNGGGALIDDGYLVDGQGLKGGTITVDAATTNRVGYIVASGDATWAHRSGWQNFTDDVKLVIGASTINNALCISNMSVQDADITFGKNINLVLNGTTVTTLASKTAITALGEGNALQIIYNNGATVVTDNVADLLTRYDIFVAEGGALDTTAVAGTYAITLPEGMKYAYAYAGDGEYDGTSAIWYGTDTITVGNAGKYQVRFTASLNDIISEDNFGGWLKQSDGTVIPHFEHENASLINILGTQLRLKDDKKDLRFIVEITKSDLKNVFGISGHNSENPDFGCIIVPESLIGEGCTFTSEHEDAAEVPAHVLFDETKQYYRYTVCLTDIADVNKVYVVKGYVDTADGRVESFSYGTSLYAVAKAAYDAHNDPDDYRKLSYTELEAVESILANG